MDDANKKENILLSNEYIRGLVEGEGCFTFSSARKEVNGIMECVYKLPAFAIRMNERDYDLLVMVKTSLGLKNKVYHHQAYRNDGHNRGPTVSIIVRDFAQLKDIIIPLFYKKLKGNKGKQFEEWIDKIGNDPLVSTRFKSLYKIYNWGVYDNPPPFAKFKRFLES